LVRFEEGAAHLIYRKLGKTGLMLSALGIGTNRFLTDTKADIDRSIEIVRKAVENGVNYIDVAHTYSKGKAEEIVREALKQIKAEVHVTLKSSYHFGDKTKEETISRMKRSLKNLGLREATFFVAWNIVNYEEFLQMIKPGGSLDGAKTLRRDGFVKHICASLHAPPEDIIKIMEHGAFEGITVTYSALNQILMQPILDRAEALDIGIITMNSLGGGIIPHNQDFFSFIRQDQDASLSSAALKFIYAHPQITTMLSGMATLQEMEDNISAVSTEESAGQKHSRLIAFQKNLSGLEGFCTGCQYCKGCPSHIDISMFMQCYNAVFFADGQTMYRRSGKRLLENINICKLLKDSYQFIPADTTNPCIKCGRCEKKCTQSIPIIHRLEDIYQRFDESGFSLTHFKERLAGMVKERYRKIAFYPGGGYTSVVLGYLREFIPSLNMELFLFDGKPEGWGTLNSGIEVLEPSKILEIQPDIVIISNYIYMDEIYNQIRYVEDYGIKIRKLHEPNDVPWQY
jgi:predicted aldo/keto reductase-like oxidoreductase